MFQFEIYIYIYTLSQHVWSAWEQ